MGDLYNRLGCSISEDSFIFGLFLVVSDDLLHPFLIPAVGNLFCFINGKANTCLTRKSVLKTQGHSNTSNLLSTTTEEFPFTPQQVLH